MNRNLQCHSADNAPRRYVNELTFDLKSLLRPDVNRADRLKRSRPMKSEAAHAGHRAQARPSAPSGFKFRFPFAIAEPLVRLDDHAPHLTHKLSAGLPGHSSPQPIVTSCCRPARGSCQLIPRRSPAPLWLQPSADAAIFSFRPRRVAGGRRRSRRFPDRIFRSAGAPDRSPAGICASPWRRRAPGCRNRDIAGEGAPAQRGPAARRGPALPAARPSRSRS